jgi:hypothetical protein
MMGALLPLPHTPSRPAQGEPYISLIYNVSREWIIGFKDCRLIVVSFSYKTSQNYSKFITNREQNGSNEQMFISRAKYL